MRWFLVTAMMFLFTLAGADTETAETESGRTTPDEVLNYIPAGQRVVIQFNLHALRDLEQFKEPVAAFENRINLDLQEQQMARVARVLGLRLDNVQSVFLVGRRPSASSETRTADKSMDLTWALRFRKPVELSNVLRLGSNGSSEVPKAEPPFATEMMNGKIIFYQQERELLVYQATPTLILLGQREIIREATRISDPVANQGNNTLERILRPGLRPVFIQGVILLSEDESMPEFVRFELTRKSPESLIIHYSNRSMEVQTQILERFKQGWKHAGPNVKKAFKEPWSAVSTAQGVKMTLPISTESADYLTQMVKGDIEFIQALRAVVMPTADGEPGGADEN